LNVLVPLIKDDLQQEHEAAVQASMPYRIAAGAKMIEARDGSNLKPGELYEWTKLNFNLGKDSASLYIKLAESTGYGVQRAIPVSKPFTSLDDFKRRGLGRDVPSSGRVAREWTAPVDDIAERARREAHRLREAELTRAQERDAERKLALRLIDIGFKVLASELHPDKGGSRDAMSRLNRVRDRLKQHA
jgi:hypothetical protein